MGKAFHLIIGLRRLWLDMRAAQKLLAASLRQTTHEKSCKHGHVEKSSTPADLLNIFDMFRNVNCVRQKSKQLSVLTVSTKQFLVLRCLVGSNLETTDGRGMLLEASEHSELEQTQENPTVQAKSSFAIASKGVDAMGFLPRHAAGFASYLGSLQAR